MHIWPLWLITQIDAQVHQFDCEVFNWEQVQYYALYIYRSLFEDKKPEPPTVFINGYSDSQV